MKLIIGELYEYCPFVSREDMLYFKNTDYAFGYTSQEILNKTFIRKSDFNFNEEKQSIVVLYMGEVKTLSNDYDLHKLLCKDTLFYVPTVGGNFVHLSTVGIGQCL